MFLYISDPLSALSCPINLWSGSSSRLFSFLMLTIQTKMWVETAMYTKTTSGFDFKGNVVDLGGEVEI